MSQTLISIIGFGKLGTHLYYALSKTNQVKIIYTAKNSRSKLKPEPINSSDLIFICTQDSKIRGAVKQLKSRQFKLKEKCIFHSSGSLSSDELKPLKKKGAYTGSFHPVQTFESPTGKDAGRFKKIYIAIEGDRPAVKAGVKISKLLKAKPFVIKKAEKIYHHIRSVIASNYLATHVHLREKNEPRKNLYKKIQKIGFNNPTFFNIYKPLARQTLENISKKGAVKSLTGPVERNDLNTIIRHIKALKIRNRRMLWMYLIMGIETVKLALKKRSLKKSEANKILKILNNHLKTSKIR